MSPIRLFVAGSLLSLAFAGAGCGGGGGGRTARFSFGSKDKVARSEPRPEEPKRRNVQASYEDDIVSPEASVQRELDKLIEREKKQAKQVADMRSALDKDVNLVRQEEEKLHDIQTQIQEFESAQRRYQQAVMTTEPAGGAQYRTGGMTIRTAGGAQEARQAQPAYPQNSQYGPAPREEVLYRAPAQSYRQEPQNYRQEPQSHHSAAQYERNMPQPVERQPARLPQQQAMGAGNQWNPPPSLYSRAPANNGLRPAESQQPANAAQRTIPNLPDPIPPRSSAAQAPQASAAAAPRESKPAMNQEVFTPDLFLSGGK